MDDGTSTTDVIPGMPSGPILTRVEKEESLRPSKVLHCLLDICADEHAPGDKGFTRVAVGLFSPS